MANFILKNYLGLCVRLFHYFTLPRPSKLNFQKPLKISLWCANVLYIYKRPQLPIGVGGMMITIILFYNNIIYIIEFVKIIAENKINYLHIIIYNYGLTLQHRSTIYLLYFCPKPKSRIFT